jgi:PAS domain S-box-containing protein
MKKSEDRKGAPGAIPLLAAPGAGPPVAKGETRADTAVALRRLEWEIAERARSERALRESEEKFRALTEATSDWIWETNADGIYTYASPKVRDLLGYEPAEVVGRTPFDFMPAGERARLRPVFAEKAEKRLPFFTLVNENLRKDGGMVVLETSGVPILDSRGELLGFRGIDRDITLRRRSEEALREKDAFIQALLDTSKDWIWAIDEKGNHTYSNPAIRVILGWEPQDLVGKSSLDFICEEDRARAAEEVGRCLTERRGWNGLIFRWRHRDGSYRYLESNSVPALNPEGALVGFRGVDRDITDRMKTEAERLELERRLLHGQKLESLGVLAGGIAHDFNNLFMAILGNLELAQADLPCGSAPWESIEQATQASRRATDLTREMLAYSGRGRFLIERLEVNALVRGNAALFRAAISHKVTLDLRLTKAAAVIEADPGQVQQVIMNLITNASEAIGDRPGTISLTTGAMDFDETALAPNLLADKARPGRFVYLEVKDDGCGMDENTLQRLFDPFFTTKFTGRGLGMSAVLGIMRGHKGAIMVNSAPGRGTSIQVLFPEAPAGSSPVVQDSGLPAARLPALGLRLVLVADDDEAVRRLCLGFFKRLQVSVLGAADGEQALTILDERRDEVDFVLLDLTMPRMDGVTAFRRMRTIRPDLRVVLTSGYDEQEALQRFAGEGLAGFLQKPFSLSELTDKILQLSRPFTER